MILNCPCGSQLDYASCCGPYHCGTASAKTPEALMRSRYSAYSMANMDYIKKTMQGKPSIGFDEIQVAAWAKAVLWLNLNVKRAYNDVKDMNRGFVEFIATYLEKGTLKTIHELSEFQCINGQWFYIDGQLTNDPPTPRNAPCPCGSGKKFKNCHIKKRD